MKYGFEWAPGIVLLGAVVVLPLVPGFALIALMVVALVLLAALVALAGAVIATPYLLVRGIRRSLAKRPPRLPAPPQPQRLARPAATSRG
jgi:hypothetical protein